MNINFSSLGSLLPKPDASIKGKFILEGKKYSIEQFNVDFSQEVDYKGQPQREVRAGGFSISISQLPDIDLYEWARTSRKGKDGAIVFSSESIGTFFRVDFINGHCVNLSTGVDCERGTLTDLYISCEIIKVNDYEHDNRWVNK